MRSISLVIALLLLAALAAGCAPTEAQAAVDPEPSPAAAAQLDKVKVETGEAAQAMRAYAFIKKVEFVTDMRKDLAAIQAELDRLAAGIEKSDGAAKADAQVRLAQVRAQWAEAKRRLDLVEGANEAGWEELQLGFRNSYGDLERSFAAARQWLSDKIEP